MESATEWKSAFTIWFLVLFPLVHSQVLSRDKTVSMVSQYSDWTGSRIVDGNYRTDPDNCQCCAATNPETNPWISIDLGNTYIVTRILVYGRSDGHTEQNLTGLIITFDNDQQFQTQRSTWTTVDTFFNVVLDNITSTRHVNFTLPGDRLLVICEADVYNDRVISAGKSVRMSSQFEDWVATRAVDGNTADGNANTNAGGCQCCAAAADCVQNSWFHLDLEQHYYINYIIIYGRTDLSYSGQSFEGMKIKLDDKPIKTVPQTSTSLNTSMYYEFRVDSFGPTKNVNLTLDGQLVICEIEIYGDRIISTHKRVELSSQIDGTWAPENAVDGNLGTRPDSCHCCAGTTLSDRPWLRIDLGGHFTIHYLEIYGRSGGHTEQNFKNLTAVFDETVVGVSLPLTTAQTAFVNKFPPNHSGDVQNVTFQIDDTNRLLIVCEILIFGECANGWFGINCSSRCGYCRSNVCQRWNGSCESCNDGFTEPATGCKTECPDYWYGNCSLQCGHCRNNKTCNKVNGSCTKCEDGYTDTDKMCNTECANGRYGQSCQEVCGHCRNNTFCNKSNGSCEKCAGGYTNTDLKCQTLCPDGTYGNDCDEKCGHCRYGAACNQTNGICERCEDGYQEMSMRCTEPCPDGTYGHNCTGTCGHCKNGTSCNMTNGFCKHCEDGYTETDMLCQSLCPNGTHGSNCTKTCGHCRDWKSCNQTNGICDQCANGYIENDFLCNNLCPNGTYGHNCMKTCGHCKNGKNCDQTSGICDQCEDGYIETDMLCNDLCPNGTYGLNCSEICGHCKDGAICNQTNGICDQCEDGYIETDMLCNNICPAGTHGQNCSQMCGNCANNTHCDPSTGICNTCSNGYFETDMLCTTECPNGTYGRNCSETCGHCKNDPCDKSGGQCLACEEAYDDSDPFCKKEKVKSNNVAGAVAGSVVGVLVSGVLVIVVIYLIRTNRIPFKKKKTNYTENGHRPYENEAYDDNDLRSIDNGDENTYYNVVPKTINIKISQLWNYVHKTKEADAEALKDQFHELRDGLLFSTDDAMEYRHKVRYKDMMPYDHTRVHLEVEEEGECEFINASHIDGFGRKNKFIASQGPMDVMVADFWRMVWQQRVDKIVMLTNVMEMGSRKCIQYWPKSKDVTYERIKITLMHETVNTEYAIRTLQLEKGTSNPIEVRQYHYKAWPDKDVPDSAWALVNFWREVFKDENQSRAPVVVHCSAGVGRTGTFIALDNLYHQAIQTGGVNPFEIVSNLRQQRLKMVQTQNQYVYLHDAVAEALLVGTHYIWQSQYAEYYQYMMEMDPATSNTHLHKQFLLLGEGIKVTDLQIQQPDASEHQIYANSEIDEYRPKSLVQTSILERIGASRLSNYAGNETFIIADLPKDNVIETFWNLLDQGNVKTVVSLTESNHQTSKVWSLRGNKKEDNGPKLLSEKKEHNFIIRTFSLGKQETSKDNQPTSVVKQFEIPFTERSLPDTRVVAKLLQNVMETQERLSVTEPILVQCRDGKTVSGLFCVLLNEVARLKEDDGHINVLESVTLMKRRLPGIVPNFVQYKYIHDVLLELVNDADQVVEDSFAEENVYVNVAM